jgi:hypothetical protein
MIVLPLQRFVGRRRETAGHQRQSIAGVQNIDHSFDRGVGLNVQRVANETLFDALLHDDSIQIQLSTKRLIVDFEILSQPRNEAT